MLLLKGTAIAVLLALVGSGLLAGAGLVMGSKGELLQQPDSSTELIQALVDAQRDQEIAAAQIAAIQANAEVQKIVESGRADVNITNAQTDAYIRKLYAEGRVDIALEGLEARRSWRTYFQLLFMLICIAGAFGLCLGFGYAHVQRGKNHV